MNQLLCPEWVGEWHSATFSTVREWESHPQQQFSLCSRFMNHEQITARTWITSSQFSVWVAAVPLPAGMLAPDLKWTEKGTNQFLKWFCSLRSCKRFVGLNNMFATDTTLTHCKLCHKTIFLDMLYYRNSSVYTHSVCLKGCTTSWNICRYIS